MPTLSVRPPRVLALIVCAADLSAGDLQQLRHQQFLHLSRWCPLPAVRVMVVWSLILRSDGDPQVLRLRRFGVAPAEVYAPASFVCGRLSKQVSLLTATAEPRRAGHNLRHRTGPTPCHNECSSCAIDGHGATRLSQSCPPSANLAPPRSAAIRPCPLR